MDYQLVKDIIPPKSEQAVVFLFALVNSSYLGWRIKRVQSDFPDCSAVIVESGEEKEVKVEFKLKATGCRDDRTKNCPTADILVCWENDWSNPPTNLQIVELRKYLDKTTPTKREWTCKNFRRLSPVAQKILCLFAGSEKNIIPYSVIDEKIGEVTGKKLGSYLGVFGKHKKEWILREHHKEKRDVYWEFNEKYRPLVLDCLGD